jgi:transcriptional regulator with XRE-family HTH domain
MGRGARGATEGFGELLRHYRVAAGLSQEALAERAGLSVHGISDLERGARRFPYPDTVQRIAVALALSTEDRARLRDSARRSPTRDEFRSTTSRGTLLNESTTTRVLTALGEASYGRALEEGRALPLDTAVELALGVVSWEAGAAWISGAT